MITSTELLALDVAMDVIQMLCAILRLWTARKRGRMDAKQKICHILIFTGCITMFIATGIVIPNFLEEARIFKTFDKETAEGLILRGTEKGLRNIYWAHFFTYVSIAILKLAFLVFYAELFNCTQTKRIIVLYIASAVWALAYLAAFLSLLLVCLPLRDNWNPNRTNPNCPSMYIIPVLATLAAVNIITDIGIIMVPLFIIQALNLRRSEKVGLVLVFGVGGLSIITTIVRFAVLSDRLRHVGVNIDTIHLYSILTQFEVFCGVLAITLPVFRSLLLQSVTSISAFLGLSAVESHHSQRNRVTTIGGSGGKRKKPGLKRKLGVSSTLTDSVFTTGTLNTMQTPDSQIELAEIYDEEREIGTPREHEQGHERGQPVVPLEWQLTPDEYVATRLRQGSATSAVSGGVVRSDQSV